MLKLTSLAFDHKGMIPKKYTCQGENINPELTIEGIPKGTKSLVLIMDDPFKFLRGLLCCSVFICSVKKV